jgi:shikimate kinase
MNIFIIGYMASGKTTIGKALAKKINFQFIDLDQYIENKEERSVSDIFATRGEIYFRNIETKYLIELIDKDEKSIISLGGGTPCYGNNLELLLNANNALSVYLKASLVELVRRLYLDKDSRPLIAHLKTEEALLEFVGKHLFERSNYYSQASRTINIDDKTIETIVEEIVSGLF